MTTATESPVFNEIQRYEIMARAFRAMTGHMAPGKDQSALAGGSSYEERTAAWDAWIAQHGEAVRQTIRAAEAEMDQERGA